MTVKKVFLLFTIISFCCNSLNLKAAEGCSDGSAVYPDATGLYVQDNPPNSPRIYRYYNTNAIAIQTYAGDPQCGLTFGTYNAATHGRCQISNGMGGWIEGAGLVYYDSATNNCSIDDYIPLIIIAIGGLGVYYIGKKKVFLFT